MFDSAHVDRAAGASAWFAGEGFGAAAAGLGRKRRTEGYTGTNCRCTFGAFAAIITGNVCLLLTRNSITSSFPGELVSNNPTYNIPVEIPKFSDLCIGWLCTSLTVTKIYL